MPNYSKWLTFLGVLVLVALIGSNVVMLDRYPATPSSSSVPPTESPNPATILPNKVQSQTQQPKFACVKAVVDAAIPIVRAAVVFLDTSHSKYYREMLWWYRSWVEMRKSQLPHLRTDLFVGIQSNRNRSSICCRQSSKHILLFFLSPQISLIHY
jgi:hypothetical protein